MSVFSSIMSKIFGGDEAAAKPDAQPASSTASASSAQASASPMNTSAAPSATSQQPVDVAAVLTGHGIEELAAAQLAHLNCRSDEAPRPRQQLKRAERAGDRVALQRRHERLGVDEHLVAQASHAKLAENGGKVPDDLKS
jgi:hypothetical protein